ncbi:MAG: hypothetical protein HDR03_09340 [Lachnospiraceae bacterium]|nr:hypothetical protein [Lachnospiraceae bacterium]
MTHSEIVKEVDRISRNKHEAWNCVFDLLKRKEHEKLNHIKVYECQDTLAWYISNFGSNGESAEYPFGFFFADYFNQLLSLRSKEAFITYEKRMHSGAKSEKDINPIFDKRYRYYLWAFNEQSQNEFAITPHTTDKELENIYNHVCWLWEYVKNDAEILVSDFRFLKDNVASNDDIYKIYRYVQRMVLLIWDRQINSSCYDKNSEAYNSNDEYLRITDEDIAERETDSQEVISPDFVINAFVGGFRYMGYENVKFTNDTESFCRVYDVPNLLHLVAEDMLRFMLHQTTHNFGFCPECGCMFATTHGNQKHCPACKEIIRQKKRRENKPRYTHKKITDYLNNNGDEENASEIFREESNYYWAIVQDKKPKSPKENWYHDDIKTVADYQKWLDNEYIRLRNQ